MINILIVDDQKITRERLRSILETTSDMQVVGIATDGNMALEQIELLKPDVVLIDVVMPNMDGINATRIISNQFLNTKVLVISSFDSEEYVAKALDAGAKGYLLKNSLEAELENSIRFITQGYSQIIGSGLTRQLASVTSDEVNSSISNSARTNSSQSNSFKTVDLNSMNGLNSNSNGSALISQKKSLPAIEPKKFNWKFWLSGWAIVNVCVWTIMLFYLKSKPPTYISEWSVILPGEAKVDLNLPDVGEAQYSVNNSIENLDPRNNILYIANSPSVLSKAAKLVGMSLKDFGIPEIETIDDSSIIAFSVKGNSPVQAQSKAFALNKSMLEQIESMKTDRAKQQTEQARNKIQAEQNKLKQLQQNLNNRKIDSDLIAPEKINNLATKIEDLRQEKNKAERDLQEANSSVQLLSSSLNLSPQQANDALVLDSDRLFQQYLQEYTKISANLTALQSNFTDNAPVTQNEKEKLREMETALLNRGNVVLGKSVKQSNLERLNLRGSSDGRDRESMARQLLTAYKDQQNLSVREQALDKQIQGLDSRLKYLAKEQLPLTNLQRESEFTEALLTSKIAQSDAKDDSSSFPVIQLLSEPELPDEPDNSSTKMALASVLAFSILSLTGLILMSNEKKSFWNE